MSRRRKRTPSAPSEARSGMRDEYRFRGGAIAAAVKGDRRWRNGRPLSTIAKIASAHARANSARRAERADTTAADVANLDRVIASRPLRPPGRA